MAVPSAVERTLLTWILNLEESALILKKTPYRQNHVLPRKSYSEALSYMKINGNSNEEVFSSIATIITTSENQIY